MDMIQKHAPQQDRSNEDEVEFYDLQTTVDMITEKESLIIAGDFNGHIEADRQGKEDKIGSYGIDDVIADGERY